MYHLRLAETTIECSGSVGESTFARNLSVYLTVRMSWQISAFNWTTFLQVRC